MGRQQGADFLDHRQGGGRRYGFTENRRTIFTQEQDLRSFAGVIGGLPVPGAVRVGAVKRGDRKSVVSGKSVSVRVNLGGRRIIKKKKKRHMTRDSIRLQKK